jgi:hypothetical protein
MNNLSFDLLIFNSFLDSFLWNIFNIFFLEDLWNIFGLIFNGVIVGNLGFLGYIFGSLDFFVFPNTLFIRNVFNSGFSLDGGLLDHGGRNYLLLLLRLLYVLDLRLTGLDGGLDGLWLLNILNWGLDWSLRNILILNWSLRILNWSLGILRSLSILNWSV